MGFSLMQISFLRRDVGGYPMFFGFDHSHSVGQLLRCALFDRQDLGGS